MSTNIFEILMGLSLLPAAGLMLYIYKMDRIEKEPKGLLVGLFFLGVGSVIPAVIGEFLLSSSLNALWMNDFSYATPEMELGLEKHLYFSIYAFLCVALVEEGFKWLFMYVITHKSRHFNCRFDGVVYAAFVSLGFAAAENVFYVLQGGFGVAALRMAVSVPAHCAFAVIMGYFYSQWFVSRKAAALEKRLREAQVITDEAKGFASGKWLALSFVAPILAHGLFDFLAFMGTWYYTVALFLFVGFLIFLCFRNVYVFSRRDAYISYRSMDMVLRRHPEAIETVKTMPEYQLYFHPLVIQQAGGKAPYAHPVIENRRVPKAQQNVPQMTYPQPTYPQYGQPPQGMQPMYPQYAQTPQGVQPMYVQYVQTPQGVQPVYMQYAQTPQGVQPVYVQYVQTPQGVQPMYVQYVQTQQGVQPVYYRYVQQTAANRTASPQSRPSAPPQQQR